MIQRSSMVRPRVPACETRATRVIRTSMGSRPRSRDPETCRSVLETGRSVENPVAARKPRERKKTMNEFCEEKRYIYKLQLFIDRKLKELRSLEQEQQRTEKEYSDRSQQIDDLADEFKRATIQIEAAVARHRKLADMAARTTIEQKNTLKQSLQETQMLKSDIVKNEEAKETMTRYREFLEVFCPEDIELMKYFDRPDVLLEELHQIENQNLFIIQHCQHIEDMIAVFTKPHLDSIAEVDLTNEQLKSVRKEIIEVAEFVGKFTPIQQKGLDEMDREYDTVLGLVKNCFESCFKLEKADLRPLVMLERIENELERMYLLEDRVAPEFMAYKKGIQDKEKREIQRKQKQAQQEAEQQRKIQQALERAIKPTYHRYGRAVVPRVIPVKEKKKDLSEKEKQRLWEEAQEQKLLFEEDD